jgi:dGTPase
VDYLEEKYSQFPGLNLTYEVREGILKHAVFDEKNRDPKVVPRKKPTLECQIVDISDGIAYNTHDLDDALQQGLITPENLNTVELWWECYQEVKTQMPEISWEYAKYETIKQIINQQVTDLVTETEKHITENKIQSSEEIRRREDLIGVFSSDMKRKNALLKGFLHQKVNCHPKVARRNKKARQIISGLFEKYLSNPELLPTTVQLKQKKDDPYQVLSDYIASMTDRFAQEEFSRLFKSKS